LIADLAVNTFKDLGLSDMIPCTRWQKSLYFAVIGLLFMLQCRADHLESTLIEEDADILINSSVDKMALITLCTKEFPVHAKEFSERLTEAQTADMPILMIAKRKLLAITDLQEGKKARADREELLSSIGKAALNKVIAYKELKQRCENILHEPMLFLEKEYPERTARLLDYHVGYKWSLPGCEYVLLFPVQPEIEFITVDGVENIRAMTPEKDSFPFLRASCWPKWVREMPTAQLAKLIKLRGETVQKQMGTTGLEWTESVSQKGYKIVGRAYKQALGSWISVTTTVLIGERSFVEILAIEPSDKSPSLQTIEFIESIEKH
jgi:hypothetical protein